MTATMPFILSHRVICVGNVAGRAQITRVDSGICHGYAVPGASGAILGTLRTSGGSIPAPP